MEKRYSDSAQLHRTRNRNKINIVKRKTTEATQSNAEAKLTPDIKKLLLESYENIPRADEILKETKNSPEEDAAQDIEEMVRLLKKKIKGDFGETEKRSLEENAEKWKEDIAILRNYIQQEAEKR